MAAFSTVAAIASIAAVAASSIATSMAANRGRGQAPAAPQQLPPPTVQGPEPVKPVTGPLAPGSRPEPGEAPEFLEFDPNMTDIQRRTAIATHALSGSDSRYRQPATQEYWKNLLGSSLIGESGELNPYQSTVLPIESQYMSQVLGIDTPKTTGYALRGLFPDIDASATSNQPKQTNQNKNPGNLFGDDNDYSGD